MARSNRRKRLRGGFTRRQFLKAAAAGTAATALPLPALISRVASGLPDTAFAFTMDQRRTLDAALARIIPAESPTDWSAASVGAGDYIEKLLSGDNVMYAASLIAPEPTYQDLSRVKDIGWTDEVKKLRALYQDGLIELDRRASGTTSPPPGAFADVPQDTQDRILRQLDHEGSQFFAALYDHTMEGVYSHPVYGGNKNREAWAAFGYEGDVHGRRFPEQPGPWNEFGGYTPEEIAQPGDSS